MKAPETEARKQIYRCYTRILTTMRGLVLMLDKERKQRRAHKKKS